MIFQEYVSSDYIHPDITECQRTTSLQDTGLLLQLRSGQYLHPRTEEDLSTPIHAHGQVHHLRADPSMCQIQSQGSTGHSRQPRLGSHRNTQEAARSSDAHSGQQNFANPAEMDGTPQATDTACVRQDSRVPGCLPFTQLGSPINAEVTTQRPSMSHPAQGPLAADRQAPQGMPSQPRHLQHSLRYSTSYAQCTSPHINLNQQSASPNVARQSSGQTAQQLPSHSRHRGLQHVGNSPDWRVRTVHRRPG